MNEILKKRIEEGADFLTDSLNSKAFFETGAEYALAHQWISVEEALPGNEDWVFVMYDIGFIEARKGIYVRINKPLCEDIKITHWMPIPKFETKEK